MTRIFTVSKVQLLDSSFLLESFINPWGEDDPVLAQIRAGAFDEPRTLNLWCYLASTCSAGSLLLDVGSFTGLFSLAAVSLRQDIKCLAFEASAITFGRLAANIMWSKRDLAVIPVNLAASCAEECMRLPHACGIYTMSPGEGLNPCQPPDHTQTVAAVPLDSLLSPPDCLPDYLNSKAVPFRPFEGIGAIKIDVEGHEVAVLEGASEILRRFGPVIICEALSVSAAMALTDFCTQMRYRVCALEGERNLALIPEDRFESTLDGYETWKTQHGESLMPSATQILTFVQ